MSTRSPLSARDRVPTRSPLSAHGALYGVVRLAGPRLPVVSFLARLPAALCPTGTLLMATVLGDVGRGGVRPWRCRRSCR
ncbi:hypothetical protein [Kitasatospora sp. NPDC017646]|uniref:hypothetical protein n=1 Tax=Kitasatospora sp. NPDC017646 TaxID=3364024 RepID=UPI003793D464